MIETFYKEIKKLKGVKIYKDVNIKDDTNIKIDTLFQYKIEIYDLYVSKKVFKIIYKHKIKFYVIGKGSNVLFSKDYNDGVLIKLMPQQIKTLNIVHAGDSLNYVNSVFINANIASLNFLTGVPCSIGGAIYMNAGAYGEEIKDIIEYVYFLDLDTLKYKVFANKDCEFDYRDSYFKHHNCLILGGKIKLNYKNKDELQSMHHSYLLTRKEKMPLEYPNLGSVFKNPSHMSAGKIIESLGLKGLKMGGCKVSDKHANVIVNYKNATSHEFIKLMEIIKDEVYMKYKIKLEAEIIVFK